MIYTTRLGSLLNFKVSINPQAHFMFHKVDNSNMMLHLNRCLKNSMMLLSRCLKINSKPNSSSNINMSKSNSSIVLESSDTYRNSKFKTNTAANTCVPRAKCPNNTCHPNKNNTSLTTEENKSTNKTKVKTMERKSQAMRGDNQPILDPVIRIIRVDLLLVMSRGKRNTDRMKVPTLSQEASNNSSRINLNRCLWWNQVNSVLADKPWEKIWVLETWITPKVKTSTQTGFNIRISNIDQLDLPTTVIQTLFLLNHHTTSNNLLWIALVDRTQCNIKDLTKVNIQQLTSNSSSRALRRISTPRTLQETIFNSKREAHQLKACLTLKLKLKVRWTPDLSLEEFQ